MSAPPPVVRAGDIDLGCWDAGGPGDPVVLMHAAWGSGESWAPQLSSLSRAGYRPIAWSRRGHRGSGTGPPDDPGSASGDLQALAEALGLAAFHLVGTAHGGFSALDYALGHSDRLASLTLVSSLCGITDPDFVAETSRLVPPSWEQLPVEVRELSPSYRFENPSGTARWIEVTARAVSRRIPQRNDHVITRAALRDLEVPTLFLTGDSDPYMPPPRMAALSAEVPGAAFRSIAAAGHSPAWERPDVFDEHLLEFFRRHPLVRR